MALGATVSVACLLRSSSSSLQRVVRISTVSARSFFSVASLLTSMRQASHSILMFSFSSSSGESARDDFVFLVCLALCGSDKAGVVEVEITVVVDDDLVSDDAVDIVCDGRACN